MLASPPTCALAFPTPWLVWGGATMAGILGCALLLAHAQKRAKAHPQTPPQGRKFHSLLQHLRSENGTATIEFALVMPILMFLVMTLIQIALLMVGFQFIQHAAFRAVRTAIVQIPADSGNETTNQIDADSDSGKMGLIKASAQYALVPVCGELEDSSSAAGSVLANGVSQYFSSYGASAPHWVDSLLKARVQYATEKTRVKLLQASDGRGVDSASFTDLPEIHGVFTYGPKDPVTVQVEHDMNLSVPYVRAIFQDGTQTLRAGTGAYTTIKTRAMLPNEGIDPAFQDPPHPRVDD